MTINSAKKQRTREWVHRAGKIDLTQKPKALCKPCWELKYCPYGALVEEFPLPHDRSNPKGCRIFGHECPVFHVAESISETRELRRASREIPQAVKTRVLFRDNRICAGCNTPIPVDFFRNRPRKNFTQAVFDALKHRWGWSDGRIYRLKNSADKHGVDPTVLVRAEMNLVERLGWQLKSGESVITKWLRT